MFDLFAEISVEMEQDETAADKSPAELDLTSIYADPNAGGIVRFVAHIYVKNFDSLSFVRRQDPFQIRESKPLVICN